MAIYDKSLDPLVEKYILPGINAMIEGEVRRVIEEAARDAYNRVYLLAPKLMAEIGVKVSEVMSFERIGHDLRITIHMPKEAPCPEKDQK